MIGTRTLRSNTSLQEVMDRAPQGDKVVVMGDLNARVGNNVVR